MNELSGRHLRALLPTVLLFTASLVGACSPTQPIEPSTPPAPPTIEALGILASEEDADPIRTYGLADGRTFEVSIEQTRVLFNGGGLGQPFVLGSDAAGSFVAIFSHQDGLPNDCHIPGIGVIGVERGAFIEVNGVLWRKAPSFEAAMALPAIGEEYPSAARFCFNDQAQVASKPGFPAARTPPRAG